MENGWMDRNLLKNDIKLAKIENEKQVKNGE